MPPRKNQPKKATAKAKPAPVKPTAKTEPAAAPVVEAPKPQKFTSGDLVRKALQLQQQHTLRAPVPTSEALGAPKGPKPTIVEFKVTLSDGTVLHATGKHAALASRQGFADFCEEFLAAHPPVEVFYPGGGIAVRLQNNVTVLLSSNVGTTSPMGQGEMQDSNAVGITQGKGAVSI